MASISVKCESCGAEFKLPATMAGLSVSCDCGQRIAVPAVRAAAPRPSAAAPGSQANSAAPKQRTGASRKAVSKPAQSAHAKDWYFDNSGLRFGPSPLEALRKRFRQGELPQDTKVYHATLGDWKSASEVPTIWRPEPDAMPKENWHVSAGGKTYGPYATGRIWDMIGEGRIKKDSMVWSASLGAWKRAVEVPVFAPAWVVNERVAAAEGQAEDAGESPQSRPDAEDDAGESYAQAQDGRTGEEGETQPDETVVDDYAEDSDPNGEKVVETVAGRADASGETGGDRRLTAGGGMAPEPGDPAQASEVWYYYRDGKREGPMPLEDLQKLVQSGKVGPADKVWSSVGRKWVEASSVESLTRQSGSTPPPQARGGGDEKLQAREERAAESGGAPTDRPGSTTLAGALSRTLVAGKGDAASAPKRKRSDVAHVPATVLTVEYVDESEGMSSGLKALEQRMAKLEKLTTEVHETNAQLVAAVNQQAKDIGQLVESLNRRIDRVYQVVSGGTVKVGPSAPAAPAVSEEDFKVPEQFAGDEEHQEAWRIGQVMASDMEAYYGDKVREGVLYQNFFDLLKTPIEEARRTYEERVSERVRGEFDYFTLALKELVARKGRELTDEASPQQ